MSEFEPKNASYYKRELLKERIKHAEIVRLARAYVDAAASSAPWEEIGRITTELREALK